MFYTNTELQTLGFKTVGKNVFISSKCSIYSPHLIEIGDNVRIDDFCILSPSTKLIIGSYIHISCYASIIGKGEITIGSFSAISGRVSIYSSNDDYTGLGMVNPMLPERYRKVTNGNVVIGEHCIVGAGSVILPNSILNEGVSIGALSLVKGEYEKYTLYAGVPAKKIKLKQTKFLQNAFAFKQELSYNKKNA